LPTKVLLRIKPKAFTKEGWEQTLQAVFKEVKETNGRKIWQGSEQSSEEGKSEQEWRERE
jgi:hypothetical protein